MQPSRRRPAGLQVPLPLVVLICVVCVALLAYENGVLRAMSRVGKPRARFWFVHVPKAGGTAVENCILRGCPDLEGEGTGHAVTESAAMADARRPVLILRQPLERLRSAFEFFKRGSDMYNPRTVLSSPQTPSHLRKAYAVARQLTWPRFVDGLTNASSDVRDSVLTITTQSSRQLGAWAWTEHWMPTTHWADIGSNASLFVCYSDTLLKHRLQCAADEVGLRCDFSGLGTVNPTAREGKDRVGPAAATAPPPLEELSEAQSEALGAMLRDDQALYDRHCGGCDERCACCHSVGSRIRDCDDPATLVQSLNQLGVNS